MAVVAVGGQRIAAHGVQVVVPTGWHRVQPGSDAPVTDPLTLLVVGTRGVQRTTSQCQLTRYVIPRRGAVVVIVGWKPGEVGGLHAGRAPLEKLTSLRRNVMECFSGRAAAVDLRLGDRQYQVNVMVGDSASRAIVAQALAVARSVDLS